MAEDRVLAAREHRGHPVTVCGQAAMADGEDADVHAMQAAGPQAMLDCAGVEPERSELAMSDDAVAGWSWVKARA